MYDSLEFHRATFVAQDVLHIELNRPARLNAMHRPAYVEFGKLLKYAGEDRDVLAIIISGSGRALTAGMDVKGLAPELAYRKKMEASRAALSLSKLISEFQNAVGMAHRVNKPVIGIAHGPCIGLAVDLLCAVDIRFASRDAVFSVREIDIGMTADIGSLQRLHRIVGSLGWVKDICFSGRNFSADEAERHGFVQYVHDTKEQALQAAIEYAKVLALKSPVALYGTKNAINYSLDHNTQDSLDQVAQFNAYALGSDFAAGSESALKRQKPRYAKL